MGSELSRFIDETTEAVRPLEKGYNLAEWESAVNGTPQALERTQQAQAAHMRFWSDGERYQAARRYDQERSPDPLLARQIKLIYLTAAQNQQDEETIDRLTSLESEVRGLYTNFRGKVDGRELSDNEMDDVLTRSSDAQEVRRVWEASKQVGEQVAAQIRELARVRNRAAQRQGFRDYFQRSLVLGEIDETQLLTLFDGLASQTEAPFGRLMESIEQQRSRHFGLSPAELEPCHYGDRFFQQVPPMGRSITTRSSPTRTRCAGGRPTTVWGWT
jgi:peptidyl-dipeptidase A